MVDRSKNLGSYLHPRKESVATKKIVKASRANDIKVGRFLKGADREEADKKVGLERSFRK